MPADEQDPKSIPPPDESAPVEFKDAPPPAPAPLTPLGRRRRGWRRVVNRRTAMWTSLVAVTAVIALAFIAFMLYRTGQVDKYVARQIIDTLAKYNIRAEVGSFTAKLGPRTVEIRDLKLYNAVTGAPIGNVERIVAVVRIEDLYSLSLRRNVNLEKLTVDHPEIWVTYDAQGRTNFADLKLPPPDPNSRILFAYATAEVAVNNAVVHYDDRRYDISGEAKNVRLAVKPEDLNAPAESRANLIDLWATDSTFAFEGRPVKPVNVELHARANQTSADIRELVLTSPLAEARMTGTLEDWRALRYRMKVNASVDLTQTSNLLQLDTTMRGAGRFEGNVSGEGDKYRVEGQLVSDALAADGVRLKALNVNATASGEGSSYEAQGKAVAELLTAGDFQLNLVQLAGNVRGTGTDFRWLGELRAASARSGETSVAGLILKDAVAELHEGEMSGSAQTASASSIVSGATRVGGAEASGVKFARDKAGRTHATLNSARAGTIVAQGATVGGVQASGVDATINADSSGNVTIDRVAVGSVNAAGARTGSINIAGVRLAIFPGGRVEGTSGDINAGTVAFTAPALAKGGTPQQGRAENVRLARPRFTLEPGGRYRASADLSLGGGVLGTLELGRARAAVVATNEQIQLNDFDADIFKGHARGSATIATTGRAATSVRATFERVDVGGIATLIGGNAVPLVGAATGTVDLRFPGTNFKAASGRVDANFEGATGREESARTPLTGSLALTADRGLFQIERANLRAGATEISARGRFSFSGGTDLALDINSSDAAEFQSVVLSTGLLPTVEEKVQALEASLGGTLRVAGTMTGDLDSPVFNGHFDLGSLSARGRNLGSLSADINSTATEARVDNGRLAEPDGGGATFTAVIPRSGENISFDATLDNANAGNLVAALAPGGKFFNADNLAGLGPASGKVSVTGFPNAMAGTADLRVAGGRIGTQPYDGIVARATFSGSNVTLDTAEIRLGAGRVNATGAIEIGEGRGGVPSVNVNNVRVQGTNVQLALLTQLFGSSAGSGGKVPALGGTADFNATVNGNPLVPTTLKVELNAQGRDVTVNGQPAGELTLVGRITEEQRFVVDLTTGLLGKPQVIHADVDLAGENLPVTVETTLTGADLTPLFAAILNRPDVQVTGTATGTLRATGNLMTEEGEFTTAAIVGRAEFTELSVRLQDVRLDAENPLVVTFKPNEVTFERTRFKGDGTNITFGGTAAIGPGGTQNLTVNGDLNMRVLSSARQNLFLSGNTRVGVHVGGTFESPQITGTASVAGASLALLVSDSRLTATEVNGQVRFNSNQASIETLTGRLGGGRISITGGALLSGFVPSQFRIVARGENVTVPATAFVPLPSFLGDLPTTADLNIEIQGRPDLQAVSGSINVRRMEVTRDIDLADLIDQRRDADITTGGGEGGGGGILGAAVTTLNLTIQGQDALVVRNNLADMVGSLNLRVQGPFDAAVTSGRITATRGTLAFRNDRYEIQRAIIDLPPRAEASPVVNIQARSDISGYRVTVAMSGPLSGGLTTTATSDPPLPQSDVIALITTGSLSSGPEGASTIAQTGIGTATSILTDTLINAPVQRATDKLFGLNRFEFDPVIAGRGGQSPTARLTVGRQINRNLAITYSTNVTGETNQVIALEYRVSDRLSFIAQYQQGSTDTLRSRSNNFNFELRFRKRY